MVFTKGYYVGSDSGIYLKFNQFGSLLQDELEGYVESYILFCSLASQEVPSFGMEVVMLSDCRDAGASSMLSWLYGVECLFHLGDQSGQQWE